MKKLFYLVFSLLALSVQSQQVGVSIYTSPVPTQPVSNLRIGVSEKVGTVVSQKSLRVDSLPVTVSLKDTAIALRALSTANATSLAALPSTYFPRTGGILTGSTPYIGIPAYTGTLPVPVSGFDLADSGGLVITRSDGFRRILSFAGLTSNVKYNFPVTSAPTDTLITNSSTSILSNKSFASTIAAAAGIARGTYFNHVLSATANNDVLSALTARGTFRNGAFTGVSNYLLNLQDSTGANKFTVDNTGIVTSASDGSLTVPSIRWGSSLWGWGGTGTSVALSQGGVARMTIDYLGNLTLQSTGSLIGSSASGGSLTLSSTSNAVKGDILLGAGFKINSSGHFLAQTDNTYDIGASGATRPRAGYFAASVETGSFQVRSNGNLTFVNNLYLTSASNGVLKIADNTNADFGRLQFGGTTSSFPAIKRNGAGIDIRLADDSGYSGLTSSQTTVSTTTTPSPASGFATFWFDGTNVKVTKNVGGTTTTSTIF